MDPLTFKSEPIAIIGNSCRYPGPATSPSELWNFLQDPYDVSQKAPRQRFNIEGFYHPNGEYHGTTDAPKAYWLKEDIFTFDTSFFGFSPREAETIDPAGKILLEVVYEGMESAGLTIQGCAGKKVGVFVGLMTADYELLTAKDEISTSQYCVTETSRAILSNRVSYFFNWTGPSMTIDTACSSSLVAMHQAVLSLRSGESDMACVAGVNVMLSPDAFTIESNLHMLSPDGHSKMWDEGANGYARGEGAGAFFLKPLSKAIENGDHIHGIIRETGVNSDGRTKGITMPNPLAQANLIRDTYARSGLDASDPNHMCQYFEAHGTGTQAGNPREAEAIHTAFFPGFVAHSRSSCEEKQGQLIVGSVKTAIGHTEGAAGVAGVLKAMLALQHRVIPPNLYFQSPNPSVRPFLDNLRVATEKIPWPTPPRGQPARASVNSFGFGGTNAHAILERYEPSFHGTAPRRTILPASRLPLLLSAHSEKGLIQVVKNYLAYLQRTSAVDLNALIGTQAFRRSVFPCKISLPVAGEAELREALDAKLRASAAGDIGIRSKGDGSGRLLGIFTGQGAQWSTMGKALIESSEAFANSLRACNEVLRNCHDPPPWDIITELLQPEKTSRLAEASISQPVCTAIQIALCDLLHQSGVVFSGVVGHSSGEIGAAYASGVLSLKDAMLIAYYRGFHAKLAGGIHGTKGGMMAVGMGVDDALDFCSQGSVPSSHLYVAASNAPASVTLSGDLEAIIHAKADLDHQKRFCRQLKVDTAYHSHHMDRCAGPYVASLSRCEIQARQPNPSCIWISSVYGPHGTPTVKELGSRYWRDNMVQPVLFAEALKRILTECGPFDAVLEVGPHAALKGPANEVIQETIGTTLPYCGALNRFSNDTLAFSDALGMVWCHLGSLAVDFRGYSAALGMPASQYPVTRDIPSYPWDHSLSLLRQPRLMKQYLNRAAAPHELLGTRTLDDTPSQHRWRNILKPSTLPWIKNHRFQGQIIIPAAAYCVMALDAGKAIASSRAMPISMVEIKDLTISNGITMGDDTQGVEMLFNLTEERAKSTSNRLVARFSLDWGPILGNRSVQQAVSGSITLHTSADQPYGALPTRSPIPHALRNVNVDDFYGQMDDIGLGYTMAFRSLLSLERRHNFASGRLEKPHKDDTSTLPVRPALLDSAFQVAFAAFAAPRDGALWTSFLPQTIRRIRFDTSLCGVKPQTSSLLDVEASVTSFHPSTSASQARFSGDIDIFNEEGQMEIQIEDLSVQGLTLTTESDDRELFLQTVYKRDPWTGFDELDTPTIPKLSVDLIQGLCERIALLSIQSPSPSTSEQIVELLEQTLSDSLYQHHLEFLKVCSKTMPALLYGLLNEMRKETIQVYTLNSHITQIVEDISHRLPQLSVLEVDLGNGAPLAESIRKGLPPSHAAFTSTSLSVEAADPSKPGMLNLTDLEDRDMGIFDLVIVHGHTVNIDLQDVRSHISKNLLRPGGFMVVVKSHEHLLKEKLAALLRNTNTNERSPRFSTSDTLTPNIQAIEEETIVLRKYSSPGIFVTIEQTRNVIVDTLRAPISHLGEISISENVLIIGGKHSHSRDLQQYLCSVLDPLGCEITCIMSLDEVDPKLLAGFKWVLLLSDLDSPILKDVTSATLYGLQSLFTPGRSLLWVTNGFYGGKNPYHSASVGLARTAKGETPGFQLQILDVDTTVGIKELVLETFLRLVYMFENRHDTADIPWVTESEIVFYDGQILIPRIKPIADINERLNSTRRTITQRVDISDAVLELRASNGNTVYEVSRLMSHDRGTRQGAHYERVICVSVTYSSVWAISLNADLNLFVGVGTVSSGRRVLFVSKTCSSTVIVPPSWVQEMEVDDSTPDDVVISMALRRLVVARLATLAGIESITLVDPDDQLIAIASSFHSRGYLPMPYYVTTNQLRSRQDSRMTFIHPQSTERVAKAALPAGTDHIVDLTGSSQSPIRELLSSTSRSFEAGNHFTSTSRYSTSEDETNRVISTALASASNLNLDAPGVKATDGSLVRSPNEITHSGLQPYLAVVDWERDPVVESRVQSTSLGSFLSSSKTYLLVGLTGELGETICRLMIENGARFFVVASRNPEKAETWARSLRSSGSIIHLASLDVTNFQAVQDMKAEVESMYPQIGGVIQGAMVLSDGLFAEMTVDSLQKALKPKVDGSQHLSDIFCENHIDFFVMLSSLTCLGGNSGQANYTSANLYMSGLAAQRRNKGLAASVIDIGVLYGIGYVNRVEGAQIYANLRKQGYLAISEKDFHVMFTEAVAASKPESAKPMQLSTGLNRWDPTSTNPLPWHQDPRFSHHVAQPKTLSELENSSATAMTIKGLLNASSDRASIVENLQRGFSTQLETMLHLSPGSLDINVGIIDLGVDSLAAVEIRSWFLREVGKDMPVLKILGGSSVATLCGEIADQIIAEREAEQEIDAEDSLESNSEHSSDLSSSQPDLFDSSDLGTSTDLNTDDESDKTTALEQILPMSSSQSRMWFPFQLLHDKTTYNCTTSYRLRGPLDVERYEASLNAVIRKHQALRTGFYSDTYSGDSLQAVSTSSPFVLKKVQHANDSSDVSRESSLIANHIYDLENHDTFIAALLMHSTTYYTVIFGYHHIIMDGVGWQCFLQEVEKFYVNPARSWRQTMDYLDFAVKQRETLSAPPIQAKRDFWKMSFGDLPSPIPLFPFARANSRKTLDRYDATETFIELDRNLVARIKSVSIANKSTTFHFYLAALQIMIRRLLRIDDVCIGITDANRSDPAFMETIGLMLDLLPLRFKADKSDASFDECLQQTRTNVYTALGNGGVPLECILNDIGAETSSLHVPLFQVLVNYRMGAIKQKSLGPDVELEYLAYEDARHPFDFILTIDEEDGRAGLTLSMQDYIYGGDSAHTFQQTFIHFLESFSRDSKADVFTCPLYPEPLVKQAIQLGKGPKSDMDWPDTLTARIDQMTSKYPDAVAMKDGNVMYTYSNVRRRVDAIGEALLSNGVTAGTRVGVFSGPSADVVLAILAIMRTGAVYIPLDERNDVRRLAAMVEDASPYLIMCNDATENRMPALSGTSGMIKSIKISDIPAGGSSPVEDRSEPDETCFVMFTSGSSGKPKGVVLSNANFLAHVKAATTVMELGRETILQQSALGYDASLAQVFYALANGGTLILSSNREEFGKIAALMAQESISLTLMAPSEYSVLFRYGRDSLNHCKSWRIAMCGGEAFPPLLRSSFQDLESKNLEVWNAYGPTELSVASNMNRVDCNEVSTEVSIGRSIPGYDVCLVDDHLLPVPVGYSGQIAVSGHAVSKGYLNDKLLTNAKFVPGLGAGPLSSRIRPDSRWYLTGDLARMGLDGRLTYMGRIDNDAQIKLRGIRIELTEITASILANTAGIVAQAAVSVRGEIGHEFLVAHVVFVLGNQPDDSEAYLESMIAELPLPLYMRPAQAIPIAALPLSMSGKLDRKALSSLPLPDTGRSKPWGTVKLTEVEQQLKEIWDSILGRSGIPITRNSSFFSVGGNSLLLLRLQGELKRNFSTDIKLPELFQIHSLGDMARRVRSSRQGPNQGGADPSSKDLNWDLETALPTTLRQKPDKPQGVLYQSLKAQQLVVIITGATGFLGSVIVGTLQDNPQVKEIHCLAVRNVNSPAAMKLKRRYSKVVLYPGDLAQPRLGLGEDEARLLFADALAIVHNGADVSFLKPYEALRESNVGSTRELVRLCSESHSSAAIHFVSTAGVAAILTDARGAGAVPELKAQSLMPHQPPFSVDGYVSSKWASEVLLEKAAEKLGISVHIYRPSSITGPGAPALDIVHNVMNLSRAMRMIPKMNGWTGWFDFISVERVAKEIEKGVIASSQIESGAIEFVHPTGELVLPVAEAKRHLEKSTGYKFREVNLHAWIEKSTQYGLSELVRAYLGQIPSHPDEGGMPSFPKLESTIFHLGGT
ncbi:putative Nonribosomal peptide synthetase 14 [Xylariomycetidae sp. FL2044]|nr:putative Nonribosomal peptide synthetase 14 [Xylariomycetidae sp. FL2044]